MTMDKHEKEKLAIEAKVTWAVRRARGSNWIAVCDPLGLTLQSETYATLVEDIAETLDGIMNDLLATHDLDRFLRDQGWHLVGGTGK